MSGMSEHDVVVVGGGAAGEPRNARADGAERRDGRHPFTVTLDDGTAVRARRLLVATGLVDELPDVPGVAERWGRDVLHCPYCHGASPEQAEQLDALGVRFVAGEVAGLDVTGDRLTGVRMATGEVVPRAAVVVAPRFSARSAVLASSGSAAAGMRAGARINADLVAEEARDAVAARRGAAA